MPPTAFLPSPAPNFATHLRRQPLIIRLLRFLPLLLVFVLGPAAPTVAQTNQRVELLPGTQRLEGGVFNGQEIRKLIGNVRFRQQDVLLFCDSAYQYAPPSNRIEAFANVRLVQGDTVTITGNHLTYDGDARTARMVGTPVTMHDPRMTLTTDILDYDLNRKQAYYTTGGHLQDPQNQLDSREGVYDTQSRAFRFRRNVVLRNPDYTVRCDTLLYNTQSKIATFLGPTTMEGKRGTLYAERGTYNTVTKYSDFQQNARVESPDYRLGGDKLTYDEATQVGTAVGHVLLVGKKDSVVIRGDWGRYNRLTGYSKVSGSPVLESVSKRDTLLIAADTLVATESKADTVPGMIYAWRTVKIWNKQVQGACDSLSYNLRDSVIFLNRQPILWASRSQLVADSMRMYLRNRRLEKLVLRANSFIVSQDTLLDFNQIKGRHMVAYFRDNAIQRVDVDGNGESLYYALDGDSALTGMNKVFCGQMRIRFKDKKVSTISFLTQPDAAFIPPHELKPETERLKDFSWRPTEKPTRASVLKHRAPVPPKPAGAKKKPKARPKPVPKKKTTRQATKKP